MMDGVRPDMNAWCDSADNYLKGHGSVFGFRRGQRLARTRRWEFIATWTAYFALTAFCEACVGTCV